MFVRVCAICSIASFLFAGTPANETSSALPNAGERARIEAAYGKLPLIFEPNVGQTDASVRFLARQPGITAFLTDTGMVLVTSAGPGTSASVVRMKMLDAGIPRRVTGLEKLPGISNYFIGDDPAQWRTGIPQYARVEYEGVYQGVDLVCYGREGRLEYDFVVAPGASPASVRLAWEGVDSLRLDEHRDLVLQTANGDLRMYRPRVYQEIGGKRVDVEAQYTLRGREVGFEVAAYDAARPLVIDPVVTLVYTKQFNGFAIEMVSSVAVDAAGHLYIAGNTSSWTGFPLANPYQSTNPTSSVPGFVTELSADGQTLLYSTYIGGPDGSASVNGIGVDNAGAIYLAGWTRSPNFPRVNPPWSVGNGYWAACNIYSICGFVTKLDPTKIGTNQLVYSAVAANPQMAYETSDYKNYMFNSSFSGMAVNPSSGAVAVIGNWMNQGTTATQSIGVDPFGVINTATGSVGYGVLLVFAPYTGGDLKFNLPSSSILTFNPHAVAFDPAGAIYVAGDWPATYGCYPYLACSPSGATVQATAGGGQDAYVARVQPGGTQWSTYLGGSGVDSARAIAADATGVYVTGYTSSTNFPLLNAYQTALGTSSTAFVTKISPSGGLLYSTYLGGTGDTPTQCGSAVGCTDLGASIAVDSAGNAYVSGTTSSHHFPLLNNLTNGVSPTAYTTNAANCIAENGGCSGYYAFFVAELNPAGNTLVDSTFLPVSLSAPWYDIANYGYHSPYLFWVSPFAAAPFVAVNGSGAYVAVNPKTSNDYGNGVWAGKLSFPQLPVAITINSSPTPGMWVYVGPSSNGCTCYGYTPKTCTLQPGIACTISGGSWSGSLPTGEQYAFDHWQNSSTSSDLPIVVPSAPATYTAYGDLQYQLNASVTPNSFPSAGGITLTPNPNSGWYNPGTPVQISAAANSGFQFYSFSGALTGTANPQTLVMNGVKTVVANFTPLLPKLTSAITARSGTNVRTWTITLTNIGAGQATEASVTNLSLAWVSGSGACPAGYPQVLTAFPVTAAPVPMAAGGGTATVPVVIDFTGCAATARFTVTVSFEANSGATSGSTVFNNQFK